MSHPFDLLMELPPDQVRLDCAALHLARDRYSLLDVTRYLQQLDALAEEVAALRPGLAANLRYVAMRTVLAERHAFNGDPVNIYDPRNCYLNHVLDTGRGAPIALAIAWIEVARRLKWPAAGVALPGHFLVRFDDPERFVLADPFEEGRSLSLSDCRRFMQQRFGDEVPFRRAYLKPIDNRTLLTRLLRTLRTAYLATNDMPLLANTLRRMAAAEPANGQHLQDLAAVCCRQGDVRSACAHLALYLRRRPRGNAAVRVRRNLRRLEAALVALN
jgi:regulator of sirC expression with transglutaminase-like and TPR domain